jgi:hypothetical protein
LHCPAHIRIAEVKGDDRAVVIFRHDTFVFTCRLANGARLMRCCGALMSTSPQG